MGIHCRCPVAWKVFYTGENTLGADSVYYPLCTKRYFLWNLPKRAAMDNGIIGYIHVNNRRKIQIDSDRGTLFSYLLAQFIEQREILDRS